MNHIEVTLIFRLSMGLTTKQIYTSLTFVGDSRAVLPQPRTHPFLASAFQSFMLASGYPTSVGYWTRSFPIPTRRTAHSVLNSVGTKAWRQDGPTGGKCVWEMHGVWGYDVLKKEGVVLRENYFVKHPMTGKKVTSSPLCPSTAHSHRSG